MPTLQTPKERPNIEALCTALKQLFAQPNVTVHGYTQGRCSIVIIHAEDGSEGVYLRYQDMPKIAEIFKTERLDFCSIQGEDEVDSYTWDGTLLRIRAHYDELAPEQDDRDYQRGWRWGECWIANGGSPHEDAVETSNDAFGRGFKERLAKEVQERKVPK